MCAQVILYTTDPPFVIQRGSLEGSDVYSVADFGPGYDVNQAFGAMEKMNEPGMSPPFNSEFYIGWLTHWNELIAVKCVLIHSASLPCSHVALFFCWWGCGAL